MSSSSKGLEVEAKSLGDIFLGLTNEVAYTWIEKGFEEARANNDPRSDAEIKKELEETFIAEAAKKVENIAEQ